MIRCASVYKIAEKKTYAGKPLVIAGAGPSYDAWNWDRIASFDVPVFALNHTITELWRRPGVWWVSNDHDRTFGSSHISKVVLPRIAGYSPWNTITQRKFIPGPLGDVPWTDHRGNEQQPTKWRLPAPPGSRIMYYQAGRYMKGCEDWVHNGDSVLELALEVATLLGFDPIVLVGCDMTMASPEEYYAPVFRYKETPLRIVRGKLGVARKSIARHACRWPGNICLISDLWTDSPFCRVTASEAASMLVSREVAVGARR